MDYIIQANFVTLFTVSFTPHELNRNHCFISKQHKENCLTEEVIHIPNL